MHSKKLMEAVQMILSILTSLSASLNLKYLNLKDSCYFRWGVQSKQVLTYVTPVARSSQYMKILISSEHIKTHVLVCEYACVCVCVWERERERERGRDKYDISTKE